MDIQVIKKDEYFLFIFFFVISKKDSIFEK